MADSDKSLKFGVEVDAAQAKADLKELEKTVIQVSKADVAAAEKATEATNKAFASKHQLKEMVKKLGEEFPILGQVGRLALNPIALAAGGITAAFVIWRKRIDELTDAMTTSRLSDTPLLKTKRIQAAKEEWDRYADSLKGVEERLNGLAAKHEATMKRIEAFFKLVNQLSGADASKHEDQTKGAEIRATAANALISS